MDHGKEDQTQRAQSVIVFSVLCGSKPFQEIIKSLHKVWVFVTYAIICYICILSFVSPFSILARAISDRTPHAPNRGCSIFRKRGS